MELRTLAAFGDARRRGRIIVITDGATGARAHRSDCVFLRPAFFERKVIKNGGRNGRYFAVASLEQARLEHRAVPCRVCDRAG